MSGTRSHGGAKRLWAGEIRIAYEEAGRGERPLLLAHGFTGFRGDFALHLDTLAVLGRTIAFDLPGHGESSKPEDARRYTLDALARDVLAFVDVLGVGACDLLGHSMGGMIALRCALAAPERVASLLLVDASPGPLEWVERDALEAAARLAREGGMGALAGALRERAANDPARAESDRRLERAWGSERFWAWRDARVEATAPAAFEALGHELLDAPSLAPRLAEIRCPTSVLVGAEDVEFLGPSEELARGIPRARRVVLPGAGHQPQNEKPEAWRAAVRAHLQRVRSDPSSAGEARETPKG